MAPTLSSRHEGANAGLTGHRPDLSLGLTLWRGRSCRFRVDTHRSMAVRRSFFHPVVSRVRLPGPGLTTKAESLQRLALFAGLRADDLEQLAQRTEDVDLEKGK